jgi:serine/threonine-protein kinase
LDFKYQIPNDRKPLGAKIKGNVVQQVGRYQILGELGRGAMGIVYKALDPAIGRTIAIKSIRLTDLTDEAERQRLRDRLFREAQSAGMLSHPNIVTIYDIAEEGEMAYIFMEFVNGPPLDRMMASAQPPDKEFLLRIFRQTAAALDYAHKRGIVHRDVKPANIMIDSDGTAKVTDFGVAKILSQNMTLTGTMMGTPSYMSPEQIQGALNIDGRADQFSLAISVYEALTGDKPFAADYLPTLLFKIVRDDFLAPQRLNPTLGPRVETVLRRAMAKGPASRYETCEEFIGALCAACRATPDWVPMPRGASQNLPTTASIAVPVLDATAATVPLPRHQPRRRVRNTIVTAAAATAIAVGAFFAIRSQEAEKPNSPIESTAPEPAPQRPAPPPPDTNDKPAVAPPDNPAPDKPADTRADKKPAPAAQSPARTEARVSGVPRGPSPPPGPSTFELTATPRGSLAIFDNDPDLHCETPCEIPLPPGRHTLTVSSKGFRDEHRIIEIPRDTGLIVNLEKSSATLTVTSNPPGLTVLIDGRAQQRKTPAMFSVTPGRHRVEVAKGAEKRASDVDIRDGATSDLSVDWSQ